MANAEQVAALTITNPMPKDAPEGMSPPRYPFGHVSRAVAALATVAALLPNTSAAAAPAIHNLFISGSRAACGDLNLPPNVEMVSGHDITVDTKATSAGFIMWDKDPAEADLTVGEDRHVIGVMYSPDLLFQEAVHPTFVHRASGEYTAKLPKAAYTYCYQGTGQGIVKVPLRGLPWDMHLTPTKLTSPTVFETFSSETGPSAVAQTKQYTKSISIGRFTMTMFGYQAREQNPGGSVRYAQGCIRYPEASCPTVDGALEKNEHRDVLNPGYVYFDHISTEWPGQIEPDKYEAELKITSAGNQEWVGAIAQWNLPGYIS